jgi:hypothetical protein
MDHKIYSLFVAKQMLNEVKLAVIKQITEYSDQQMSNRAVYEMYNVYVTLYEWMNKLIN